MADLDPLGPKNADPDRQHCWKVIDMENDWHGKLHNSEGLTKGSKILDWKMIDMENDIIFKDWKMIDMENDWHGKWHNFCWLEKGSKILHWKMIYMENDWP